MVDISLLTKEIDDLGVTKGVLAEKCKISKPTLNNWLKNPDLITAKGAKLMADALRITDPEKLMAIFFAPDVQ